MGRRPVLLPLSLHREERNSSFSVCYVCIFYVLTCSIHDTSKPKDYDDLVAGGRATSFNGTSAILNISSVSAICSFEHLLVGEASLW
jgi:hypothetical protein